MPPGRYEDFDEREKRSWSEVDKKRDKSSHRRDEPSYSPGKPKQPEWAKKQLLKQADQAFKKKLPKDAQALLDKIHKTHGTKDFPGAVNSFVEKYGMPNEWRILILILDHPDVETFKNALAALQDQLKSRNLTDKRTLKTKLSIISNSASDLKIQRLAEKAKNAL